MTRPKFTTAVAPIVAALGAVTLSACSALPRPPEVPELFQLSSGAARPDVTPAAASARLPAQIVVQLPIAPFSLETNRIAILTSAYEIKYLKGSRWSDNAPKIAQAAMIESLEATQRFAAVGRPTSGFHADYTLVCELRDFEADLYSGRAPVVRIRLMAQLIKSPAGSVVASRDFSSQTTADGSGKHAIVRAFDGGLQGVVSEIGAWVQESLSGAEPTQRVVTQTLPGGSTGN